MDANLTVHSSRMCKRLTAGAAALGVASAVNTGGQYLLTVLLLRLGGVELLGLQRFVASVFMIGQSMSLPEAAKVLIRHIRTGVHGSVGFLKMLRLRWSIYPSAVFAVLGCYFLLTSAAERGISFLLLAIVAPFVFSFEIVLSYLQAFENYPMLLVYAIARSLLCLAVAALFCLWGAPPWLVIVSTFASYAVVAAIFFYLTVRELPCALTDVAKEQARRESLELTVVSIANQAAEQVDKVLLGFVFGDAIVGGFYAAVVVPRTIGFLIKPAVTVMNPHFVTKQVDLLLVGAAGVAATALGVVAGLFSDQIVRLALGGAIGGYQDVTRVMFSSLGAYLAYQLLRNWALFNVSCDTTLVRKFELASCGLTVVYALTCVLLAAKAHLLILLALIAPLRYLLGIGFYSYLRVSR